MKVFPIAAMGGVSYLKSLQEPFGHSVQQPLQLMVCGGIALEDVAAYTQSGALAVGLGKSLLSTDVLNRRDGDLLRSKLNTLLTVAV
jgi:2-dehydro-3-deoxyphosphogluconate aldolase/(4S)-4-hydroxy-2-oxoglutarate aldolase